MTENNSNDIPAIKLTHSYLVSKDEPEWSNNLKQPNFLQRSESKILSYLQPLKLLDEREDADI